MPNIDWTYLGLLFRLLEPADGLLGLVHSTGQVMGGLMERWSLAALAEDTAAVQRPLLILLLSMTGSP